MQTALSCYSSWFYLTGRKTWKMIYPWTPTSLAPEHRQADGKSLLYINVPSAAPEKNRAIPKKSPNELKTLKSFFKPRRTILHSFQKILQNDNWRRNGAWDLTFLVQLTQKVFHLFLFACIFNTQILLSSIEMNVHEIVSQSRCCKSHGKYRLTTSIYLLQDLFDNQ